MSLLSSYPECVVLLPSVNGLLGTKMPDLGQYWIIQKMMSQGMGIVVSEWFHFLQSISVKRSFEYNDDGSISASYKNSSIMGPKRRTLPSLHLPVAPLLVLSPHIRSSLRVSFSLKAPKNLLSQQRGVQRLGQIRSKSSKGF